MAAKKRARATLTYDEQRIAQRLGVGPLSTRKDMRGKSVAQLYAEAKAQGRLIDFTEGRDPEMKRMRASLAKRQASAMANRLAEMDDEKLKAIHSAVCAEYESRFGGAEDGLDEELDDETAEGAEDELDDTDARRR